MSLRDAALATLLALGAGAGCGSPVPGPDEVTTPVTEGDEEAWSRPGDPAPPGDDAREPGADDEDDDAGADDEDDDGDG